MKNKIHRFFTNSTAIILILLSFTTILTYWKTMDNDFISFDDPKYITTNIHVNSGLKSENVIWAFQSIHASNWHPLTWISHMTDCELFGLNPRWHHMSSLSFHVMNTLLLFCLLLKMTGKEWPSALVAALFALHPMHVESVVWVSERKDVLSTFFGLSFILCYVNYARQPSPLKYLWVMLLLSMGLMSKPMLVTFPFVLLLLDYWPLCRLPQLPVPRITWFTEARNLIIEKIPLFALVALSSFITLYAQKAGGAVASPKTFPLSVRFESTLSSFLVYLGKMFAPINLSVFYPYSPPDMFVALFAGSVLIIITGGFLYLRKRSPYGIVGWLWFIGTLFPVIGLVKIGEQGIADRYTYVPFIGLFIVLSWGLCDFVARHSKYKVLVTSITISVLMVCMGLTWRQVGFWKNSVTVFEHAIDVTEKNDLAHKLLGHALMVGGNLVEAVTHYKSALKYNPNLAMVHNNLGAVLSKQKKYKQALFHYSKVLKKNPNSEFIHYNMGRTYAKQGDYGQAIFYFGEALRINPGLKVAKRALLDSSLRQTSKNSD